MNCPSRGSAARRQRRAVDGARRSSRPTAGRPPYRAADRPARAADAARAADRSARRVAVVVDAGRPRGAHDPRDDVLSAQRVPGADRHHLVVLAPASTIVAISASSSGPGPRTRRRAAARLLRDRGEDVRVRGAAGDQGRDAPQRRLLVGEPDEQLAVRAAVDRGRDQLGDLREPLLDSLGNSLPRCPSPSRRRCVPTPRRRRRSGAPAADPTAGAEPRVHRLARERLRPTSSTRIGRPAGRSSIIATSVGLSHAQFEPAGNGFVPSPQVPATVADPSRLPAEDLDQPRRAACARPRARSPRTPRPARHRTPRAPRGAVAKRAPPRARRTAQAPGQAQRQSTGRVASGLAAHARFVFGDSGRARRCARGRSSATTERDGAEELWSLGDMVGGRSRSGVRGAAGRAEGSSPSRCSATATTEAAGAVELSRLGEGPEAPGSARSSWRASGSARTTSPGCARASRARAATACRCWRDGRQPLLSVRRFRPNAAAFLDMRRAPARA